jgi:hypothetical protein
MAAAGFELARSQAKTFSFLPYRFLLKNTLQNRFAIFFHGVLSPLEKLVGGARPSAILGGSRALPNKSSYASFREQWRSQKLWIGGPVKEFQS